MAQFRAIIRGQRGEASRLGSKSTGITADVSGWTGGVRVEASHTTTGEDQFVIYVTTGSDGTGRAELVGVVDYKGRFTPSAAVNASGEVRAGA